MVVFITVVQPLADKPGPSKPPSTAGPSRLASTPVREVRPELVYVQLITVQRKLPDCPDLPVDDQGYVEAVKLGPVGNSKHKYMI